MLTYRDRTYCNNKKCERTECPRRLTEEVCKAAEKAGMYVGVTTYDCTGVLIDEKKNSD
jgi:hypothetical protein